MKELIIFVILALMTIGTGVLAFAGSAAPAAAANAAFYAAFHSAN